MIYDTRILYASTVCGAEERERFLFRSHQNRLNNQQSGYSKREAQGQALSQTDGRPEREEWIRAVSTQSFSGGWAANIKDAPFVSVTSEELLVHSLEAGIPVHMEKEIRNLLLGPLATNQKGVDNPMSKASETLVNYIVHSISFSAKLMSLFLDAVIGKPGWISGTVISVEQELQKGHWTSWDWERIRETSWSGIKNSPPPSPGSVERKDTTIKRYLRRYHRAQSLLDSTIKLA